MPADVYEDAKNIVSSVEDITHDNQSFNIKSDALTKAAEAVKAACT